MWMLNFLTETVKSAVNPDFLRLAMDFKFPSFTSPINSFPFSGPGLLWGVLEIRFFTTAMTIRTRTSCVTLICFQLCSDHIHIGWLPLLIELELSHQVKLRKDESMVTAVPTELCQDCRTHTYKSNRGIKQPLRAFSPEVAMWIFWKAFPCEVEDGGEGVVVEGGGEAECVEGG